jgi:hypothetical protein
MPITPDPPYPKSQGDIIRSKDWNQAVEEIKRLDNAKANRATDRFTGPLAVDGHLSVGAPAAENAENWSKVIDLLGAANAKLSLRTAQIDARALAHEAGWWGSPPGMIVGTKTNHSLNLATQARTRLTIDAAGRVGIGLTSPDSPLHILGGNWNVAAGEGDLKIGNDTYRLKIGVALGGGGAGDARIFAQGGTNRLMLGSGTADVLTIMNGRVGIGTSTPESALDVHGAIRAGSSDIYFTETNHNHTGIGNAAGFAAIENAANYDALMILGRAAAAAPHHRVVSLWDELNVNGTLVVRSQHTIKIGVPSQANPPRYGNDGIRGEPNLWLDAAGAVYIKQGFQAVGGFDIAERFQVIGEVQPGQVVVFDEDRGGVRPCDREYDRRAVGIVSAEPAFILGIDPLQPAVALCGRVECYVDADIAPVRAGDLLSTSPTAGHAQKVLDRDRADTAIIGKALGSLESGKGKVMVWVMQR